MNEYISRESVNRIISEAIRYCDNQSDQTDDLTLKFSWDKCSGMLESVKESIDNITNADVRPVVYGEWIPKEDESISKRNRIIRYKVYSCSICGRSNGRTIKNFCPPTVERT